MEESKGTYYFNGSTKLVKQKFNPKTYLCVCVKKIFEYHVSHHYFMKTNSWLVLEKKLNFFILC